MKPKTKQTRQLRMWMQRARRPRLARAVRNRLRRHAENAILRRYNIIHGTDLVQFSSISRAHLSTAFDSNAHHIIERRIGQVEGDFESRLDPGEDYTPVDYQQNPDPSDLQASSSCRRLQRDMVDRVSS